MARGTFGSAGEGSTTRGAAGAAVAAALAVVVGPGPGPDAAVAGAALSFGVFGLVARRDPGDALRRLADKVEQVEAGAYGVDLSTDRDDAVGQLYDAVDSLSETLRESERERVEERRRRAVERGRRRALFEAAGDPVVHVELDDGVVVREVNPRFEAAFGVDGDEAAGEPLFDLVRPAGTAGDDLRDRLLDGDPVEREVAVETVDGTTVATFRFRPVDGEDGAPPEGFVRVGDVDDRGGRVRGIGTAEGLLRAVVEASPAALVAIDHDGDVALWNPAAERIFGWSAEEVLGEPLPFVPDERRGEFERLRDRLADGESVTGFETRRRCKDGSVVDVSLSAAPLRDDDGDVVGVMSISRDVTGRRERERELRDTKRRLELALEGTNTGIWEWDPETGEVNWNETLERSLGLAPGEFEGTFEGFVQRVHPDERPRVEAANERAAAEDAPYRAEFRMRHEDGHWVWVESRGRLVRDPDGGRRIVGIHNDVTERKERERWLRERERQFEAVFEDPKMLVALLDTDGTLRRVNDTALSYVDADREEVVGEPFASTPWWRDTPTEDVEAWLERAAAGEYVEYEAHLDIPDGGRHWVSGTVRPVTDDGGDVVSLVVSARNVTERRKRERELRRYREYTDDVLDAVDDVFYVLDADGTLRRWNESLPAVTGYDDGEIAGMHVREFFEGDERNRVDEAVAEALETGTARVESEVLTADGRPIPYEFVASALEDPDGNRVVAGVGRDITERTLHEQQLRQERDRFLTLFENLPNPVARGVHVETEPVIEFVNPAFEEVFGVDGPEIRGRSLDDVVVPDDRREEADRINRQLLAEGEVSTEVRRSTADGLRDFQLDSVIRNPGADKPEGYSIWTDVTERKERERQLRERERRLQRYREYTEDVLEAIDDVFYLLDGDWTLQRWNGSLNEVTGYSDAEIEAMDALDFFPGEDAERVAAALDDIEARAGEPLEVALLTKDGETVPFELVAAPLEDPDGNRVIAGIGRDISARKEKERELSRLVSNVPGYVYRGRNEPGWPTEFVSEGVRDITGYDPDELVRGEVVWGDDVVAGDNDELWQRTQRALQAREPYDVVYPIDAADGERRWVREQGRGVFADDGTLEALEGVVIDVTERVEYERELERTRHLLEQSQRLARVGAWEVQVADGTPVGVTATDETYRIHDLPTDADLSIDEALSYYHPEDRERVREAVDRAITDGEGYDLEARLRTAEGNERWVRTIADPVREDGAVVAVRGSIQDVTERKRRERALTSLHDLALDLQATESEAEVARLVADAAGDVLEVPGVCVYLLDDESNRLEPAAFTDVVADRTGGEPPAVAGDSPLWRAFATGTPASLDDERPLGDGLAVPVGDHGVLVLAAATVGGETRQLAETLVATTEAALDRLASEASLRERDAELEARNRRLRRQVQITDIIRRIDQSLIGADSREEIEAAVPERLVEAEDVAFAWVGGLDPDGDRLVPRAWAGSDPGYLDEVPLGDDGDAPEPAVATARMRSPVVVENVVDRLAEEPWRSAALAAGFHSVVAVPLSVGEHVHGVLAVYADEPGAFGDLERTVFAELGENIANSIDAVRTRQALHADTFVELDLQFGEADEFLARVARGADARVEYEGLGTRSEGGARVFFTTAGAPPDAVRAVLDDLVAVTDARLVSAGDDRALFEAAVDGAVLPAQLVQHGASPRSLVATPSGLEAVVHLPAAADVRAFVETLRERYPGAELAGRRDVERGTHTRRELVASLLEPLTDRQLEVLRTAYYAGFFEWPRESTGEDVAELLGVSQPTVNRHLRLAQGRLLAGLFDEEVPPPGAGTG